jgi:hypothetical protein
MKQQKGETQPIGENEVSKMKIRVTLEIDPTHIPHRKQIRNSYVTAISTVSFDVCFFA